MSSEEQQQQPQYVAEDPHTYGTINGQETEWALIQRKLGNIAPRAETPPSPDKPTHDEFDNMIREFQATTLADDELHDAMEERSQQKDEDDPELQALKSIYEKRRKELQQEALRKKFGKVMELTSKQEYVQNVSEASKKYWVVCHLYSLSSKRECQIVDTCMERLAQKFLTTKFVRIRGNIAIDNFPDSYCPSILVYHDQSVKKQWVGYSSLLTLLDSGAKVSQLNEKVLEWQLNSLGAIVSDMKKPPIEERSFNLVRKKGGAGRNYITRKYRDDEEYSDEDNYSDQYDSADD